MENNELVEKVVSAYAKARAIDEEGYLKFTTSSEIIRKKNRVQSSFLEDVLAVYVGELLNDNRFEIWIDQTFQAEATPKNKTFNPDITIVQNGVVVGFIEVKDSANPFRWNSNEVENKGIEYIDTRVELYQTTIAAKEISYILETGNSDRDSISVSDNPFLFMVLFSDKLFSEEKMGNLREYVSGLNDKVKLFTLIKGHHPNTNMSNLSPQDLIAEIMKDQKTTEELEAFKNAIEVL